MEWGRIALMIGFMSSWQRPVYVRCKDHSLKESSWRERDCKPSLARPETPLFPLVLQTLKTNRTLSIKCLKFSWYSTELKRMVGEDKEHKGSGYKSLRGEFPMYLHRFSAQVYTRLNKYNQRQALPNSSGQLQTKQLCYELDDMKLRGKHR